MKKKNKWSGLVNKHLEKRMMEKEQEEILEELQRSIDLAKSFANLDCKECGGEGFHVKEEKTGVDYELCKAPKCSFEELQKHAKAKA